MLLQITPENSKDVLNDKRLVVLWFSGDGCGPCRQAEPIIKNIAQLRWPNIVVGKVDMDANEALAKTYNVEFVPTILLFKNQICVDKIIGFDENFKSKLATSIDKNSK